MLTLKLKRNHLGGLICPLPKEPVILWPAQVHHLFTNQNWEVHETTDGRSIMGSFTNGNSRMAQLEPLKVFGDLYFHVAFGHNEVDGDRHDTLFVNLKQAHGAIKDWLTPPKQNYSKQQAWLSRNRDKMRDWRREYMRQYRAKGNGKAPDLLRPAGALCTKWPVEYGVVCDGDRPCDMCQRVGPKPYCCDWCGSFTTRSAEAYCRHIESGCPVLHHRPLRRNKLGGLVCPQVPGR